MEMRRSDRLLSQEETQEILASGEYGVLSTVSQDGSPYGVPVSYAVVDGKIYIHGTNQESHKAANMEANPQVSFTVVGSTEVMPEKFGTKYASVIAFGKARKAESDEEREAGLMALVDKYSAPFREGGAKYMKAMWEKVAVFVIDIETITGKARKQ